MTKPHIKNDKYESTGETVIYLGQTFYRIRACKSFGAIAAGAIGGFIASEGNLSVSGNARVYDNARVYGNARVYDNARVYGNAHYITISPIGSGSSYLTAFIQSDGTILFNRGCFSGNEAAIIAAIDKRYGASKIGREYRLAVELCKLRLAS